ncbi:MAG: hypothetical protein HPY76_12145 [Anaerolineae bacterium]|nr:hypothetical protein [Anaerolineae bacterium]
MRNFLLILLGVLILLCAALLCAVTGIIVWQEYGPPTATTTKIPWLVEPSPNASATIPTSPTTPTVPPTPALTADRAAWDTLERLQSAILPEFDRVGWYLRFNLINELPTLPSSAPYQEGQSLPFWIYKNNFTDLAQVRAELRYRTDSVYFWVEDGVVVNEDSMRALIDTFTNHIYPTTRRVFGSEWLPGIDGDPRLHVLLSSELGTSVGAYFGSSDELHPAVNGASNAKELIVVDGGSLKLEDSYTYGTLAHEFQHMIQYHQDPNEERWLDEGLSEMATQVNGYASNEFTSLYVEDPDLPLLEWSANLPDTWAHYGASFLFLSYFYDRVGESGLSRLATDPLNGITSIESVLASTGQANPSPGASSAADALFADWAVTTYLQDATLADGRYTYRSFPNPPRPDLTEHLPVCPSGWQERTVNQYGVDYIHIDCPGETVINFQGVSAVALLPVDPPDGTRYMWSNRGELAHTTLRRQFDFSDVSGDLTLEYQTWYRLVADYDSVYLFYSLDGVRWQPLEAPGMASGEDGYVGESGGWLRETVDLSALAGSTAWLSFEYVGSSLGDGWLLDDVRVPQTGYATSFEDDDGGWQAAGFVNIGNSLPQSYQLSLIRQSGGDTSVERLTLDEGNGASLALTVAEGEQLVLVVSGSTRYTRTPAAYRYQVR